MPKFLPGEGGALGPRNGVSCGALEKKMGIKASATCVMNFDGATGFLIGPPNKGLECMFTFMNSARIGTAIQGVAPPSWPTRAPSPTPANAAPCARSPGPRNPTRSPTA